MVCGTQTQGAKRTSSKWMDICTGLACERRKLFVGGRGASGMTHAADLLLGRQQRCRGRNAGGASFVGSEGAAGLLEKVDLVGRRGAPKHAVSVREATEPVDDRLVRLGPFGEFWIIQRRHQRNAAGLGVGVFCMLEWQVEKQAFILAEARVEAPGDGLLRQMERSRVGGEGARRVAKHVA